MKPKNVSLRRRLAYVESQLESESLSSRHSPRLKEERQRRLTEEKIAIQKSLDSTVYPILTLPVEITAAIFVHCLPEFPGHPSRTVAPMLLGRICRRWRNIACSTPRLWAALRITRWKNPALSALLASLWFRRAGGAPKSLSLQFPLQDPLFRTIGRRDCVFPAYSSFIDHWAHLSSFRVTRFNPAECLALLSCTPRLARCAFDDVEHGPLPSALTPRLMLPNLEHLSLNMYFHPSLLLLDSITCPNLRSFKVHGPLWNYTDTLFLPFLERAPHIEAFTIAFCYLDSGILIAILNTMPTLTSLRVVAEDTIAFRLLRSLSESATFLPRIANIVLAPYTRVEWTDSQVKTFADAVTSRWEAKSTAQLLDFEFAAGGRPLDDRIRRCVSGLRGKGMRIYVGPHRVF